MQFSKFMASTTGRVLRVVVGLVLVIIGILINDTIGYVISIIGLIPFAAGLFDWCVIAPLLNMPFQGKDIRSMSTHHEKTAKKQ